MPMMGFWSYDTTYINGNVPWGQPIVWRQPDEHRNERRRISFHRCYLQGRQPILEADQKQERETLDRHQRENREAKCNRTPFTTRRWVLSGRTER